MRTSDEQKTPVMGRIAPMVVLALAAALAGGCAKNRPITTHSVALDAKERHRIDIGHQISDLQIYPVDGYHGMSDADRTKLIGFLRAYRNDSETGLQVSVPSGAPNEAQTHAILQEIHLLAAGEGIRPENLSVMPYNGGGNPNPPVYLSYGAFAARTGQCGLWPRSINAGPQNLDYYNFGCATQANLARMVSDPRDLAGPRAEDPSDPNRRRTVFDKYRKGEDTATVYADPNAGQVSQVAK